MAQFKGIFSTCW